MSSCRRPNLILAALLIALALVVRAALPLGWMPTQTDSGIRVMLCSGKGTVELMLPRAGNETPYPGDSDQPRDPCPFGVTSADALDIPPHFALAALPAIALPQTSPEALTARLVAARAIRPPARGPPLFA